MAEVEVGLRAVVEHVDFAVLVRAHRPGIDIDVGVELLEPNPQSAMLQQHADRGAGQSFAERTDHAAGHENMLGHRPPLPRSPLVRHPPRRVRPSGDRSVYHSRPGAVRTCRDAENVASFSARPQPGGASLGIKRTEAANAGEKESEVASVECQSQRDANRQCAVAVVAISMSPRPLILESGRTRTESLPPSPKPPRKGTHVPPPWPRKRPMSQAAETYGRRPPKTSSKKKCPVGRL